MFIFRKLFGRFFRKPGKPIDLIVCKNRQQAQWIEDHSPDFSRPEKSVFLVWPKSEQIVRFPPVVRTITVLPGVDVHADCDGQGTLMNLLKSRQTLSVEPLLIDLSAATELAPPNNPN